MMNVKQTKIFEIIFALVILALYGFVAISNVNAVLNWFLTDDAFYYFQVARNVSEGAGFTFDGINLSNGFHPLWMFVCIPVFSLARFNIILPFRILIMILGFLHVGSFILLFRLLKRFIADEIAVLFAVLWGFSPIILNNVFKGGVESGINVFFILFFWERLSNFNLREKIEEKDLKYIFFLGVIGLLTILSRLDNVYLIFLGGVWLWLKWWHPSGTEKKSTKEAWIWRFKTGTAFYGIIASVMTGYLVWNKIGFGDFMPVSGKIKIWWGNLYDSVYGHRVINSTQLFEELFSPNLNVGPWALLVSKIHKLTAWLLNIFRFSTEGDTFRLAVWGMMIIITITILLLILLKKKKFFDLIFGLGLIPFFLGTLTQAAYYKRFGSIVQRSWYWVSEFIFITIIVAVLTFLIYSLISKWKWVSSAVIIGVIALSIWLPMRTIQRFRSSVAKSLKSETHEYLLYGEFMEENFEHGTVVGLTGSGAWGYFSENFTTINLDGLINSVEYFERLKNGTGAELLARNGLDYVIGSKYILTESRPYTELFANHLKEINLRFSSPNVHLTIWEFVP